MTALVLSSEMESMSSMKAGRSRWEAKKASSPALVALAVGMAWVAKGLAKRERANWDATVLPDPVAP